MARSDAMIIAAPRNVPAKIILALVDGVEPQGLQLGTADAAPISMAIIARSRNPKPQTVPVTVEDSFSETCPSPSLRDVRDDADVVTGIGALQQLGVVSDRLRGTIWWDFDGTLVWRPSMWSGAARRLIARASIACADLPEPLLSALDHDMPWHGQNCAHPELSTPDQWWASVFATYAAGLSRCGWSHAATPAGFAALRSEILDPRAYSLFEDVVPTLTALTAAGWRHVIVSNHVPELADIVAGLGIRAFFADVITSGLVGYEKPHARLFEAAVRCAIPGAPIWMIGDDPDCDCHPVRAFGAHAILVRAHAPAFERHAADLWQAARLITGS